MDEFTEAVAKIHRKKFAKKLWDAAVCIGVFIILAELYAAL